MTQVDLDYSTDFQSGYHATLTFNVYFSFAVFLSLLLFHHHHHHHHHHKTAYLLEMLQDVLQSKLQVYDPSAHCLRKKVTLASWLKTMKQASVNMKGRKMDRDSPADPDFCQVSQYQYLSLCIL